jgi:hypothetical protein
VAKVEIIRPDLPDDAWDTLSKYLIDHYERAQQARTEQVDGKYERWENNFYGIPAEKIRTVPWYKASNFVVKVIRIFIDTFCARTLNIIFATRPLYTVDGFPAEVKEGLELYLNRKALNEWHHYELASAMLERGNKNGTSVCKQPWLEETEIDVMPPSQGGSAQRTETEVTIFSGPRAQVIPFEDFLVYPITANTLDEVVIKFHKVRYVEEQARRMMLGATTKWDLDEDDLKQVLETPQDAKRMTTQEESGVVDPYLRELHVVECYLRWELVEGSGKYYNLIAIICPKLSKMIDLYFNPYPRNIDIFTDYRPNPKEDFFYGESMCELLESTQEEVSNIHNSRRDNNFIANAPVFKRRSGSLIPNPSTNWYPGKVFDLEAMDDFELVQVGRNFNDTLQEEQADLQYAERLSGIGPLMQGMSQGAMGKKGMYNTGGTLAVLAEGNQRQDSNIRDFRQVLSRIVKVAYSLQSYYGKDDPTISIFPAKMQDQIKQALAMTTPAHLQTTSFEVKTSDAGANSEVARANLMQMAAILGQYGNSAQQMVTQLANPQLNPALREIMLETITMQQWMAKRLLRAWNEYDAEGVLPDVNRALAAGQPQAAAGPAGSGGGPPGLPSANGSPLLGGGANQPQQPLRRQDLASLSQMLNTNGGAAQ